MSPAPPLVLGLGDDGAADAQVVGRKAATLARLRSAGFPVPDGFEMELGWIVRRPSWGSGIATEAARAWRCHAFAPLGSDRIVSMISEQNVASRRVAQKLGMTVERPAIWDGRPMLMYACVRPPAVA